MPNKKIAVFCFCLIFFALMFGFTFEGYTLGDTILKFFFLPAWSHGNSGTHYTVFYSFGIILLSTIIFLAKCNLRELLKNHKSGFITFLILFVVVSILLLLNFSV